MAKDIYMAIDDLPAENIQTLAERLEARAQMHSYADMRERYFDAMDLANNAQILELGAGTGIVGRAYASRSGFTGVYTVSDLSAALVEYAKVKAAAAGLSTCMAFCVADAATGKGLPETKYDAVILHTLISHVPDPKATFGIAVDAARPGGTIAIFDADYASLEIVSGDQALDDEVGGIRKQNGAHQSKVMRRIPKMAKELDLEQIGFLPEFLAEAGESEFFLGLARASCGVIMAQGALDRQKGESWLNALQAASDNGTFFGMCPYFTYLYRKP